MKPAICRQEVPFFCELCRKYPFLGTVINFLSTLLKVATTLQLVIFNFDSTDQKTLAIEKMHFKIRNDLKLKVYVIFVVQNNENIVPTVFKNSYSF